MRTFANVCKNVASYALPFLVLLLLWQLMVDVFKYPKFILPSPAVVINALCDIARWKWHTHIAVTAAEMLGGFLLSAGVGIILGMLIAASSFVYKLVMPFLVFFNSLPKIAMAPLFIIWLGYGIIPNMWISFFIAFFPVVIDTAAGIRAIDPEMLDLGRLFNASRLKIFLHVCLPNALPHIFAGLKVASTFSVIGAIIGEFIASTKGLAGIIIQAQTMLTTEAIFAALIWISALGLGLFGFVSLMERVFTPWAEAWRTAGR
ncbi:MAG: ABC transporter permease [Methanomassiliicoccales archaeon]|nr:ABC transporter permease [Methanomassiliicoccales archaeon]